MNDVTDGADNSGKHAEGHNRKGFRYAAMNPNSGDQAYSLPL